MAGKDIEKLTEEDRLMRQFAAVERFGTKLQIMSFMTNFPMAQNPTKFVDLVGQALSLN